MPDENELEELTNSFLDGMITLKGADTNGRKTEQAKVMGVVDERCGADCVSCKNVLQD